MLTRAQGSQNKNKIIGWYAENWIVNITRHLIMEAAVKDWSFWCQNPDFDICRTLVHFSHRLTHLKHISFD